ncbi:hypothetical protein P280DRAFT_519368 [Massarina eburnea CBS 473.64]|uniref:Uncharacterized protein n=1 Tax=Massarina eburnea CBS 473.64 TaxID=1395130 RepID=A0A6A6RU91_9PLEO|nr:hypothetical protein P280DRAFT_519368 [Massarina eburnea CBS 473.64]
MRARTSNDELRKYDTPRTRSSSISIINNTPSPHTSRPHLESLACVAFNPPLRHCARYVITLSLSQDTRLHRGSREVASPPGDCHAKDSTCTFLPPPASCLHRPRAFRSHTNGLAPLPNITSINPPPTPRNPPATLRDLGLDLFPIDKVINNPPLHDPAPLQLSV